MNSKLAIDNSIIITDSVSKSSVITYLSSLDKLLNIRVMTYKELLDNYYFKYDEKAIYYLMHKYHFKYDVALVYLSNMYYIDQRYNNQKFEIIYDLKEELMANNLLNINVSFKEYLQGKKIVFYNIDYVPNIIRKIINCYDFVLDKCHNVKRYIYEFKSLDDEVYFVATEIADMLKSGMDINKLYLTNLNEEYRLIIKRLFGLFNIPVLLNDSHSIYSTRLGSLFLKKYDSDIKRTLVELQEEMVQSEVPIYNSIVNICNKYVWCDDYLEILDLIIHDLKNTKLEVDNKINCVHELTFGTPVNDDDYVFLLGFNQGSIPIIYKNEDYFSDKDKELIGIETSVMNNVNERKHVINTIKRYNNLIISYKLKTLTDVFNVSNINDELAYEIVKKEEVSFNYSHKYNQLKLGAYLDLYNKYGIINHNLSLLYNNYPHTEYRTYDNQFTFIDKEKLYKYLDNKLLLSYSSLDNYNRCGFRYYINNILKLNVFEENFVQVVGNLFHYVLSKAFMPDFDYDECFDHYIDKELSYKEQFFIKKMKEELRFIITVIKEHEQYTMLNDELYEEKVYVNLEGNITVTFMGVIDKLKYKKIGDKYIVAIVDYKTGNPNLNLNNVIYGIEMQLPIYIFLAKHHPRFDNIEVAGFYLQKILHNEISNDHKHTYLEQKKKNLLLQGYSTSNIDILEKLDSSYNDSKMIKGLKTSAKGFYAYSKILSGSQMDKLSSLVEENIKKTARDILNAYFTINPKRIGDENIGCAYCTYKDLCFYKEKDIINLKEYRNLEFLGGEEDA